MRNYIEFYFSNEWENHTKQEFPHLLFILPDLPKLIYLKRFLRKELQEQQNPPIHISLETREKTQTNGITASPWEDV